MWQMLADFTGHFLQIGKQLSTTTFREDNDPFNDDTGDRFYSVICKNSFMVTTFQNTTSPDSLNNSSDFQT